MIVPRIAENRLMLNHPNLKKSLLLFMRITASNPKFPFSEKIEKEINRIQLVFDSGADCYTDFNKIVIGLSFPFFTENVNENYNIAKGIIGHEVGHLKFTSKKEWTGFCNTVRGKYKGLHQVAIDFLNIVEDMRIEYWMAKTSKFLEKMFYLIRYKIAEESQKKIEQRVDVAHLTPLAKIEIIRSAALYIRCTRQIPKIRNKEILEYVKQIYPYIIYCERAKSTRRAVQVAHKIMEIIAPLREQYKKEKENGNETGKPNSLYPETRQGTYEPMENEALDGFENGPSDERESEPKSEFEEEFEQMLDELAERIKSELEGIEKSEEDSGSDESLDTDKTSDKKRKEKDALDASKSLSLGDIVNDITKKIEEADENIINKMRISAKKIEKEIERSDDVFREFLNSTKKTKKQKVSEELEAKKIAELKPVLVHPEMHDFISVKFEKNLAQLFTPVEYSAYLSEFAEIINLGAKRLLQLSEQRKLVNRTRKNYGFIDRRKLVQAAAFGEKNVFYRKKQDDDKADIDILILVDNSGSNAYQVLNKKNDVFLYRYEVNRIAAIVQHEILKKAKINHAIWSFEEIANCNIFKVMIDFSNCFAQDSGLFLKNIDAMGDNRDGFAISYAGEYLLRHGKSNKKLLIVISDGEPCASGYGGKSAINDVKKTVEDLDKKGVKTIGVFTGHPEENRYFEVMYANHIFFNNENIYEMPGKLCEIIQKEYKLHLLGK